MSEDEAINKATKFVQEYREKEQKFYDYLFSMKENDIPIKAIDTILDLYQQEKEKNKELEKQLEEKEKEVTLIPERTCFMMKPKNVVSKDKIKEKIESIENTFEVCDEEINYRLKIEDKAKIEVLTELLEEE